MSDLYTEHLVKRKTPASAKAIKILMIVVTVVAVLAAMMISPIVWVVALGMILLDYFKLGSFDLEYEYLYVNGELDIDKIMSQQKRKRVASYDMSDMEILAPTNSHELDSYRNNRNLKIANYSSQEENAKTYTMIISKEGNMEMVILEPNDIILKDIQRMNPRKVKLS